MSRPLSTLRVDRAAFCDLTYVEQQAELEVARAIICERIVLVGLPVEAAGAIVVTMSTALTSTLGKAMNLDTKGKRIRHRRIRGERTRRLNDPQPWPNPRGEIRLSASGLWLRDTPEGREDTVIHELGHLCAESKCCGAGHGPIWREIVKAMGGNTDRCHMVPPIRKGRRAPVQRAPVQSEVQRIVARVARGFRKGDVVVFGRRSGEQTKARVVRVNKKSLTLQTLETRGQKRVKGAGEKWRVARSLCRLAEEQA